MCISGTNLNYEIEYAVFCPLTPSMSNRGNKLSIIKWNSWPTSQPWATHSLSSSSQFMEVHPSGSPGKESCSHPCLFPFPHTSNPAPQKIVFPYLGSISPNASLLIGCTATRLAWATTISSKHYYHSFLTALPTSPIGPHPSKSSLNIEAKTLMMLFKYKFCAKSCSGCQFLP